ncbi:uncharacterized protein LOC144828293 [Lissotriton helveticus]
MKTVVVSLLAAALLFGTAHSLKCYVCASTTGSCNTQGTCAAGEVYCASATLTSGSSTTIAKACMASCTAGSGTVSGVTGTVSCCQQDLCNGANSVKINYAMVFLAAGISALLLKGGL